MSRRAALGGIAATAGMGGILAIGSTGASDGPPDGAADGTTTAEEPPDETTEPVETETSAGGAGGPSLGANLNGRPRRLGDNLDLLDESGTTWVRAFLDIRDKLNDGVPPETDPDVVALRRAAREKGCRLVVSLKWGFKVNWGWDDKETVSVPAPGSDRERELLACAARYLRAIGAPVDVVVLGNEPMWETKREDVRGKDPAIVRFTRNLKEHLVRHGDHGTPTYLVGAFNRLTEDRVRDGPFSEFCRGMFELVGDDDVDGVDIHVHYAERAELEEALGVARERVPDGTITVTEFTPAFRYDRHVRTRIGEWEAGRRFADEYGYSPDTTAVDYFELAKDDPRPRDEMGAFYGAMPWYRADELVGNYRLFERFDVEVGAFGFLQGEGMRGDDWRRPDWTPFHIGFLYQSALIQGSGAHPLYMDDYRELAG